MGRPPSIPAEKKTRIVVSVLAGGDHRDGQRWPVPVLPLRILRHRPPRTTPRAHPGEDPGAERIPATRLRHAEVRTALPG